jgi:hypothetical protein
VTPDQAANFFEADEDPAKIFAAFDRGPDGRTQRPRPAGPLCAEWRPAAEDFTSYDCQHNSCWEIAEGQPVSVTGSGGPGDTIIGIAVWRYPSGRLRVTAPWDLT